jgi:hypothetical protein
MSTQRDFAKEWSEALREYEIAKEAYFDLSGAALHALPPSTSDSRTQPLHSTC